jgi:predicted nucleotidyltransferase component of viral defense system
MDDKVKVLTPFQEEFIIALARTPLQEPFFLTGGTALAAFYLQHRISEDMDFFTEEEGQVSRVIPIVKDITSALGGELDIKRNFRSYVEFFVTKGEDALRCDFALDSPYRLQPKVFRKEYGISVDNVLDISCNKLSALYDRGEPKDFVDVYFIDREVIPFEKLVEEAKKKHVGLESYSLAVALAKVEEIRLLPRMLKPVTIDELKRFFQDKARWLMKR